MMDFSSSFLFPAVLSEAPDSWTSVIMLPGIFVFFGFIVLILGYKRRMEHETKTWTIVSGVLFLLAAILAWPYFSSYAGSSPENLVYRDAAHGRRMMMAHYLCFILPVLGLLSMVVGEFIYRRRRKDHFGH